MGKKRDILTYLLPKWDRAEKGSISNPEKMK
jgi:hypothetical protein